MRERDHSTVAAQGNGSGVNRFRNRHALGTGGRLEIGATFPVYFAIFFLAYEEHSGILGSLPLMGSRLTGDKEHLQNQQTVLPCADGCRKH